MCCSRYLGLYKEEVEAAIAYDKEAVRRRGIHAITNFDLSEYIDLLGMQRFSCVFLTAQCKWRTLQTVLASQALHSLEVAPPRLDILRLDSFVVLICDNFNILIS